MGNPWDNDPIDAIAPWANDPIDSMDPELAGAKARSHVNPGQELRNPDNSLTGRLYSGLREYSQGFASALPDWSGQPLTRGPGAPQAIQEAKQAAHQQGTGEATRMNTPAADWGRTSAENLALTAATGTVGAMVPPPVKGAALYGARKLASEVGEAWMTRPGQQVVETVMGSGGQVVGEDTGRPEGGVVGYGIGATAGGNVARLGRATGRGAVQAGKNLYSAVTGKKPVVAPNTFLNAKADPLAPIPAARDRIDREISIIESDMSRALAALEPREAKRPNQYPSALSPADAEARFYPALKAGKARAAAIETRLWTDALSSKGVPASIFQKQVETLQQGLLSHDVESAIPDKDIAEILGWKGFVSPKQLQAKISELGQKESAIWQDTTYRGNKLNFSRNLEAIRDILLTSLENSVKDPAKLAEAKAFTAARKELYTKGPIWEALTTGKLGTIKGVNPASGKPMNIPFYDKGPGATVGGFQGGAEQIKQAEVLSGYGGAKTLPLSQEFENVMKAEFAAASRTPDGKVDETLAAKWMKENRPRLAKTGKLANDLDVTLDSFQKSAAQRERVLKSSYAKFAGANSDKSDVSLTVRAMFSSPDRVAMARDLRTTFDNKFTRDPQVLEAYQNQVITQLFARNNDDFRAVKRMMADDPNVRRVIEETFRGQSEKIALLDRILAAGERMADHAEKGTLAGAAGKAAVFVGGLGGATLGRLLSTGTIQVPAYMAKGFRGAITKALGKVLKDPASVVNYAMTDPRMAKWLLKKYAPNTETGALKEAIRSARAMNTLITQVNQTNDKDYRAKFGLDGVE